jgi:hypothetical protein
MSVCWSPVASSIVDTLSQGLPQGGEFVTARARKMVQGGFRYYSSVAPPVQPQLEKLRTSKFNTSEDISAFTQRFDEGVKRVFSDDKGVQYIKFGSPRDHDPKHGIKSGKLMLTG